MTKTQSKGKKKKGSSTWSLQKIGIIVIGVGFAVIMVVSSLGTGWLVSLNSASVGDHATISLTFYDGMGRPVLTSDARKYNQTAEAGGIIWLCEPRSMYVGETTGQEMISIPVFNYAYGESKYALFSTEYNTIAKGIAGMRQGESKKISIPPIGGLNKI